MPTTQTYRLGKWVIEPSLNQLSWNSVVRRLEPRAMEVLVHLMDRPKQVVSQKELLMEYWTAHTAEPRKISKRINQIRNALDDDARRPTYVQTIHKRGYRIIAPIEVNRGSVRLGQPEDFEFEAAYQDALACMGLQDYRENWWSEAEARFRKVVDMNAEHAMAWSYLSLLHVMRCAREGINNFNDCEEMAGKALAIDGGLGLPHVTLGYCALLGRWNIVAARSEFEQALARTPDDPTVLHGYQLLLLVEERDIEVLKVARQLRRSAPNDIRYQSELIKLYYQSRYYEDALVSAEGVRRSNAGYFDMSEASALHAVGRFKDSYKARLATYKLLGAEGEARAALLESGWKRDGYIGALKALSEYQLTNDSTTAGLVPSEFLLLPDRAERLMKLLRRDIDNRHPAMIGLLHHPEYDVLRVYSTMHDMLGEFVCGQPAESPARRADVARIRVFRGEAVEVVDTLQKIITERPEDRRLPRWIDSLAWAYFAMGDLESAIELTEGLLDRDISHHSKTHILLLRSASLAESEGRMSDARNTFFAACELWPGELKIDRDVAPLFFGGDRSLELRFIGALKRVSRSLEAV